MPATPGAAVSARRFHDTVRRVGAGAHSDIPHLSAALIEKYLSDIRAVGLLGDSQ
jgi:fatty acid CoA ligase FadD9